MNKTKRIAFGIGIVLAVLAVFTASAAADNVFYLVPQNSSGASGEDITVWVMLNASDVTDAFDARIYFDLDVVNITSWRNPESIWDWWDIGHHGTYIHIGGMDFGGGSSGVLGLANLTLKGNITGISSLHFDPEYTTCGFHGVQHSEITRIDGTFACNKSLPVGWNLVSRPDITADNSTASVLAGVYYDAVYRYDATSDTFVDVSDGTMEPGVGYFVHVTAPSNWTFTGTPYTQMNLSLKPGLNMIGWLDCTKPISEALSSIEGKYWYVARWNATTQEYEIYNPVAPPPFNDFDTLEPTTGYWISMKESGWLNVSC